MKKKLITLLAGIAITASAGLHADDGFGVTAVGTAFASPGPDVPGAAQGVLAAQGVATAVPGPGHDQAKANAQKKTKTMKKNGAKKGGKSSSHPHYANAHHAAGGHVHGGGHR